MAQIGQPYASGRWLVNAGSEDEFIERWTTFTQWPLDNAPGAESFVLIRDTADPRRFLSLSAWESQEAVRQWREKPEFSKLRDACRELCEYLERHDYSLAASPSR
jgi:heme-degrading monooxygenase HmoA